MQMFCYQAPGWPTMPLLCIKEPLWEAGFKHPFFSTTGVHWSLRPPLMSMEQNPLPQSLPSLLQAGKRKALPLRTSLCSQRFRKWSSRGSRWSWPRKSGWGGSASWGSDTWGRRDDGRLQRWRRTRTFEHHFPYFFCYQNSHYDYFINYQFSFGWTMIFWIQGFPSP